MSPFHRLLGHIEHRIAETENLLDQWPPTTRDASVKTALNVKLRAWREIVAFAYDIEPAADAYASRAALDRAIVDEHESAK